MKIQINQESHTLEHGKTIKALLSDLGYQQIDGLALAINDEVVPKKNWEEREVQPDDRLTLIQATQGG